MKAQDTCIGASIAGADRWSEGASCHFCGGVEITPLVVMCCGNEQAKLLDHVLLARLLGEEHCVDVGQDTA